MDSHNEVAATVYGPVVQAQVIHGDVHLQHPGTAMTTPRQLPRAAATVVGREFELALLDRYLDEPAATVDVNGT
ncbi:hypothetical protein K7G98_42020, partial [Saccharothrix sp. MB29]|nr:hypothetical protein [Saccharothrix sp. MB29]